MKNKEQLMGFEIEEEIWVKDKGRILFYRIFLWANIISLIFEDFAFKISV